MGLLVAGIALWFVVHSLHAAAPGARAGITSSIGEGPWKGLVALLLVASIALIVFGWRSVEVTSVYVPPTWAPHLTMLLMLISVLLFGAANGSNPIRRTLRHPMLTGMALWGIAHLIANGDNRSVVLFGSLLVWSVLMMVFINKRDGAWEKPEAGSGSAMVRLVVISVVVYAVLLFAHPYFTGRTLIGS